MNSLFDKPKTKKEQVYDFIKSKGRARTSEVIKFSSSICNNRGDRDARDLAEEGRVWRVRREIMMAIAPGSKEKIWSVYESDKTQEKQLTFV